MLAGKLLLFDSVPRNPFYLKQQLDYYGAMGCGFKLDDVTVDRENDRGRVLCPEYLFDLTNAFDGRVFGWSKLPIDLDVTRWLGIPGYVLWDDRLLTGVDYTRVIDLFEVDPAMPPAVDVKLKPVAFLRSEVLFEMSYLSPARVYELAAWLKSL